MMTRRTIIKFLGLLPVVGPTIVKAVTHSACTSRRVCSSYIPVHFPKWDRAVDGLESAGKWAMEIESSWLPRDLVFPRLGQIWEAVRDCEVPFRTSLPFQQKPAHAVATPADLEAYLESLFGVCKLHKGERVRVVDAEGPKPVQVTFVPLRYQELHERIVPEGTRKLPGYSGYVLHLKTAQTIVEFNRERQSYFTEAFKCVADIA